ncbi:MAG: DMT family transporter [Bacteroides sp.]|nr:DMT family transporter [Ruminococcus flavefaciens]MCM1554064.1 DMT family transporter [Bacteroides sp.]
MNTKPHWGYHLLALGIVTVWGSTFVSTKLLLNHGLNPQEIFFYRFLLAYLLMAVCYPKQWRAKSGKDELLCALAGITGGSLYFYTENSALTYTATNNIALILCIAPLVTALLLRLFSPSDTSPLRKRFWAGSLIALSGVACVILNGHFVLHLSPKGDLLCLAAALCWGFYTVLVKKLERGYNNLFITRKVFFYGLLTILPLYISSFRAEDLSLLQRPVVFGNLLFLGIVASLLCFFFWNKVLKNLDPIRATNYIYLSPVVTATASFFVLHEPVTPVMLLGAALTIGGVYLAGKMSGFRKHRWQSYSKRQD